MKNNHKEYKEEDLRKYIERCFKDAFKAENRKYSEKLYKFEWILVKNKNGIYQLYSYSWCKFQRVLNRVMYRLKNKLYENFGIIYGDTDEMSCSFLVGGYIDFNYTQAMFKTDISYLSLSIYDEKTNIYENGLRGECMPAYTKEKLLFKYWGIDAKTYMDLPEDAPERFLPYHLHNYWEEFKSLYNETFETEIGSSYDIICSSGIERL